MHNSARHQRSFIQVLLPFFHLMRPSLILRMTSKPKLNVHKFPRPPLLERTDRHLQIKWGNEVVIDSPPKESYWVLETTVGLTKPIEAPFQRLQTRLLTPSSRLTASTEYVTTRKVQISEAPSDPLHFITRPLLCTILFVT